MAWQAMALLALAGQARRSGCVLAVDAKRELADNRAMSVADQARYPGSVLCRFLDSRLPQRAVVAEDWSRGAASAPWTPVWLPEDESRQRLGLAAEMRIGLDLGDAPAYFDLLSFLPPAEYGALLDAAGFSPDESPVAVTGTADPLLFDWRRVQQPVRCDDDQRAALAACLEAAGMRNVTTLPRRETCRGTASTMHSGTPAR